MSWDQEISRQDVQGLLLEILGVDPNELLRQVIDQKLAEQGLSYEVEEDTDRVEGDGFHPRKITFSDGRVFVETLTEEHMGDAWGSDYFGFIEAGKPYNITRVNYNDDEEGTVTEERVPGDDGNVTSLEEIRDRGNALTPGLGDETADFFAKHGITEASFEPSGFCVGGCCVACGSAPESPSSHCECVDCHGNSNV